MFVMDNKPFLWVTIHHVYNFLEWRISQGNSLPTKYEPCSEVIMGIEVSKHNSIITYKQPPNAWMISDGQNANGGIYTLYSSISATYGKAFMFSVLDTEQSLWGLWLECQWWATLPVYAAGGNIATVLLPLHKTKFLCNCYLQAEQKHGRDFS